jgi:hypothetical protein
MWMQVPEPADVLVAASVGVTGFERELVESIVQFEDQVQVRCFRPFHQSNGQTANALTMRRHAFTVRGDFDGEYKASCLLRRYRKRKRCPHDNTKEHKWVLVVQKGNKFTLGTYLCSEKQSKQLELTRGRVRYDENSGVGNSLYFRKSLQVD